MSLYVASRVDEVILSVKSEFTRFKSFIVKYDFIPCPYNILVISTSLSMHPPPPHSLHPTQRPLYTKWIILSVRMFTGNKSNFFL